MSTHNGGDDLLLPLYRGNTLRALDHPALNCVIFGSHDGRLLRFSPRSNRVQRFLPGEGAAKEVGLRLRHHLQVHLLLAVRGR